MKTIPFGDACSTCTHSFESLLTNLICNLLLHVFTLANLPVNHERVRHALCRKNEARYLRNLGRSHASPNLHSKKSFLLSYYQPTPISRQFLCAQWVIICGAVQGSRSAIEECFKWAHQRQACSRTLQHVVSQSIYSRIISNHSSSYSQNASC